MRIEELERVGEFLDELTHLVIWQRRDDFEVVAIGGEEPGDAFPLPLAVQGASAEAGLILDTRTAAFFDINRMPDDFWDELSEVSYGTHLQVSILGRPGVKYLQVIHAVRFGDGAKSSGNELKMNDAELLQVTRWLREESIFDHRSGDLMMEVLSGMSL